MSALPEAFRPIRDFITRHLRGHTDPYIIDPTDGHYDQNQHLNGALGDIAIMTASMLRQSGKTSTLREFVDQLSALTGVCEYDVKEATRLLNCGLEKIGEVSDQILKKSREKVKDGTSGRCAPNFNKGFL